MKYILPTVWIIIYMLTDAHDMGYNKTSPLYTHITYLFSHAGLIHLITNIIAFIYALRLCNKVNITKESIITSTISAILATFIMISDRITVGASGFIYAMITSPLAGAASEHLTITNKKTFIQFYGLLLICAIIQPIIFHNINSIVHFASIAINFIILFLYYQLLKK